MGEDMSAGSSGKRINNPILFPLDISLKGSGKDLSVLSMKLVRISDLIHSKQKAARFSILQTATNIDQPSSHKSVVEELAHQCRGKNSRGGHTGAPKKELEMQY